MDFERLYSNLPDFIKYNRNILNFFLGIAKRIHKLNINDSHKISPQEFKVSDTLRKTQLLSLELLRFIDNVCNKHNIDYWLTAGTLLGAVRHGGFIPWDDDIDVNFMREDYEKFIEIIPNEISKYDFFKKECGLTLLRDNHENYFKDFNDVYDFEGDGDLLVIKKLMFLQLAWMKPYVKIDFFPQEYVRDDKLTYFKKNYVSTKYRLNDEVKRGKKRFNEEFVIKSGEVGFTQDKSKYVNDSLDTVDLYRVSLREFDKIFPLKLVSFENYLFKCPNDNDYFLKELFGNYMKLPDEIVSHNVVPFIESQFNSKEEMDAKFEEAFNYLKNINDNFK